MRYRSRFFYIYAAEYVAAGADGGNINNLMMLQAAGGKVIALKVIEFNSPCDE